MADEPRPEIKVDAKSKTHAQDCASGNCKDGACGGRPCLE
jgi:hypothetical protein